MDAKALTSLPYRFAAFMAGRAIILFARFITAAHAVWQGTEPVPRQRVYFANHTSNGDFVLVWAVLPSAIRDRTRPVAASDYWLKSKLRAFIGRDVFKAVLIDRNKDTRTEDPVELMTKALDEGSSLIIFPEGKRNMDDDVPLLPFKTGLYHVGKARPEVDLVPVHIHNLNKVMPKGEVIPVPLTCTITFGAPIHVVSGEPKEAFLKRASDALLELFPK
jgi:1-acyl-sn-glycerol-3-phosphate acyltransferase